MRRRVGTVLFIGSFAVLLLAFAGCGGGGGSESASPTTTATTETTETTASTATTETTETETTETTGTATSTVPNFAGSGKCKDLAESAQKFTSELTSGTGNFKKAAEDFENFVDEVPSEIRADVQALADVLTKYADALEGVDLTSTNPDPETLQKLQELSTQIDQQKVQQASQNIAAWVQKNC